MKKRLPIWKVAANILNKQSPTADKVWSSSLGIERGANISSPQKRIMLRNSEIVSLGPELIMWCDLRNEKQIRDLVVEC
jgi:hypothetical protein